MGKVRTGLSMVLILLLVAMQTGCGGGGEVRDAASYFENAELLESPATLEPRDVIILDARHSVADYNAGHITGAIFAPPYNFTENAADSILLPVPLLEEKLGALGLTRTSTIVIYDDTTTSLGAAGRLFWMLEYLGCPNVSILNGGWDKWQELRPDEVEKVPPAPLPAAVFIAQIDGALDISKEQLLSRMTTDDSLLIVDARSPEEYRGQVVNSDPRPGHIPGAINLPYSACYYPDRTVLNYQDLNRLFANHGITKDKDIVVYSTVGKRSSFIYFLSRLMGYTRVVNYSGSIVDWGSADPALYPMETD